MTKGLPQARSRACPRALGGLPLGLPKALRGRSRLKKWGNRAGLGPGRLGLPGRRSSAGRSGAGPGATAATGTKRLVADTCESTLKWSTLSAV